MAGKKSTLYATESSTNSFLQINTQKDEWTVTKTTEKW
jgi:hypothetical protein